MRGGNGTTANITIDKSVPIPPPRSHVYPWAKMVIGDSILVPTSGIVATACKFAKKHPGYRFRSRKERLGWRIWRVPP